ncbi:MULTISPECIES: hypothetical protein [Nitrospira]|uniref:Uncharacterized protein n=2 Tax=Nitrospira TaxID=1234 RepID=A0AA86MYV5_9BACT|nr:MULTISPECIES: hypothetical protein [Nitrospira]CAE6784374.1 conserved hypothetical protein [Nitrospira defluvii]CAI4031585.1 hypothetical protein DNFV4_02004 [Nitrospira tepida]
MFDMFWNSVLLFFKGKLFHDLPKVMMLAGVGMTVAAVILIVLAKLGVALWIAVLVAGLSAGALQPRLFRDLKYR